MPGMASLLTSPRPAILRGRLHGLTSKLSHDRLVGRVIAADEPSSGEGDRHHRDLARARGRWPKRRAGRRSSPRRCSADRLVEAADAELSSSRRRHGFSPRASAALSGPPSRRHRVDQRGLAPRLELCRAVRLDADGITEPVARVLVDQGSADPRPWCAPPGERQGSRCRPRRCRSPAAEYP
jgi:hypothetical protein